MLGPAFPIAVAAPVVFGGAELLILFAWLVLLAILYTYRYTLGALILGLAHRIDDVWVVGGTLSHILENLDHAVQAAIGYGLVELEQTAGKVWEGTTIVLDAIGDAILFQAHATYDALRMVVGAAIPNAVGHATRPLAIDLGALRQELRREAARLAHNLTARAVAIESELDREFGLARRGIDHIQKVDLRHQAGAIAAAVAAIAALRRYAHGALAGRITRLEELLGLGIIGAAAIAALTRVFPYWQCTNVRRFNRFLCRFPLRDLEGLLALTFEAAVVTNICEAVHIFSRVAQTFEPELRGLVAVTGAAVRCGSGFAPPELEVRGVALPPYTPARPALPV